MKINIKQFVKEVNALRDSMRVGVQPYEFHTDFKAEPYWKEIQRQEKLKANLNRKRIPKLKTLLKFVDENGLQYKRLSDYQHRIKNPNTGKFVDWWDGKKEAYRDIKGDIYYDQGVDKVFLLQEIAKLI